MTRIKISVTIDAPPGVVWADIADISTHVEWMADAREIRFTTDERAGVGARFVCVTQVGPIRLDDTMTVTRWDPSKAMGISHDGLVSGVGEFRLRKARGGRTRFTWDERLAFPWWMAGPVGGLVARPILRAIWKRNLGRLAARFAKAE